MFADDTNSFCSNREIEPLIWKANLELGKTSEYIRTNKLSLSEVKTGFTLFHRSKDRDNLPLRLHVLKINGYEIKRLSSIKFIRILMDLSWIDHINTFEKLRSSVQSETIYKCQDKEKSLVLLFP